MIFIKRCFSDFEAREQTRPVNTYENTRLVGKSVCSFRRSYKECWAACEKNTKCVATTFDLIGGQYCCHFAENEFVSLGDPNVANGWISNAYEGQPISSVKAQITLDQTPTEEFDLKWAKSGEFCYLACLRVKKCVAVSFLDFPQDSRTECRFHSVNDQEMSEMPGWKLYKKPDNLIPPVTQSPQIIPNPTEKPAPSKLDLKFISMCFIKGYALFFKRVSKNLLKNIVFY